MHARCRYRPGATDLAFLVVLVTALLAGHTKFLRDPGTFWHLQLGREILRTGDVPRADTLTFTRQHAPWVDQSWGFDLVLALVVDHAGWPGAVALTALLLAWLYAALAAQLLEEGRSPPAALLVTILAAGVGAIHFLTRPHLLTFVFVLLTLHLCRQYHRRGGRSIAWVPPMMVVWANVHGGFLAGPLIVATAAVGHAISGPWVAGRRRRLRGFALVFGLSCVAPLVNPYGLDLYRHVFHLLHSSRVTDLIDEYQPSPFGRSQARILEWFVLALVFLPVVSRNRPSRYECLHVLVWLHLALTSIRHAPLFALAAAPTLALLLDGLWSEAPAPLRSTARFGLWPGLASLLVVLAVAAGRFPGGPDAGHWPIRALPALNRQPVQARLFHEQDWGGLIESECRPRRLAYLDDRFELWGRKAILEYIDVLQGGPAWDEVRTRDRVDLVWIKPGRGLARRLEREPGWEVVHRDELSVLFRRRPTGGAAGPEQMARR